MHIQINVNLYFHMCVYEYVCILSEKQFPWCFKQAPLVETLQYHKSKVQLWALIILLYELELQFLELRDCQSNQDCNKAVVHDKEECDLRLYKWFPNFESQIFSKKSSKGAQISYITSKRTRGNFFFSNHKTVPDIDFFFFSTLGVIWIQVWSTPPPPPPRLWNGI